MKYRRFLCIVVCCLGLACIVKGVLSIRNAQIRIHRGTQLSVVTQVEKPVDFWVQNGVALALGSVLLYGGGRGLLSNKK